MRVSFLDQVYNGRLLAVTSDTVVISVTGTDQILGFSADKIKRLKFRRGGFLPGLLKGTAAGLAIGLIGVSGNSGSSGGWLQIDLSGMVVTLCAAGGAVTGGLVGGLSGGKSYRLSRMKAEKRSKALNRIRSKAEFVTPDLPDLINERMIRISR